jgi:hypothetical protein
MNGGTAQQNVLEPCVGHPQDTKEIPFSMQCHAIIDANPRGDNQQQCQSNAETQRTLAE